MDEKHPPADLIIQVEYENEADVSCDNPPGVTHIQATQSVAVAIRPMEACDVAAVAAMARELASAVDDPEPALDASDILRNGIGSERWFDCLVAIVAGEVAGYVMTCRGYEAHVGKRRLWVSDLYVRKETRGVGVGRALMTAAARRAIEQGCDTIYWDLWRGNVTGRSFYKGLGASEVGDLSVWRLSSVSLAPAGDDLRNSADGSSPGLYQFPQFGSSG